MSERSQVRLREMLHALAGCVADQADKDPEFARALRSALLEAAGPRPQAAQAPSELAQPLNPILVLQEHGEAGLRERLNLEPDSGLDSINRFQRFVALKEWRKLERSAKLRVLEDRARSKLNQGMVVAKAAKHRDREREATEGD